MDVLLQDLRAAYRSLRRSPGFALAFILTLGVAIGASAAVLDAIRLGLLDPLPYPEPQRLVEIWETRPEEPRRPVAPANFLDWQRQARSFASMAVFRTTGVNVAAAGQPENLMAAMVSGDFFATLRPEIAHGRALGPEDTRDDGAAVVIAPDLAIRQFGSIEASIGATLDVDRRPHHVVGVIADGVAFPRGASLWMPAPDDIPPVGLPGVDARAIRDARYLGVIARLTAETDIDGSRREMETIAARLRAAYPVENEDSGIGLQALARGVVAGTRPMLLALGSSVALLLGVACANITGLALARSAERRGEIALRAALGASGRRVARQLLTELALLLAMSGAIAGAVGWLAAGALRTWLPVGTPRLQELGVDGGLLGSCLLIAAIVGTLLALVPGRLAARLSPGEALHRIGSAGRAGGRVAGMRALVSAQFALAVAVVAAAGLLLSTLAQLAAVDPGFEVEGRTALRVHLPGATGVPATTNAGTLEEIATALETLPGVDSVGIGLISLLREGPGAGVRVEGVADETTAVNIRWTLVDDNYFRTLGIPLHDGRAFVARDNERAEPVAIINATAARLLFPASHAIGRRIRTGLDGNDWVRIVGVVGDTRNRGLDAAPTPRMYRPLRQPTRWNPTGAQLLIAGSGPPSGEPAIRAAVAIAAPGTPVTGLHSLRQLVAHSFGQRRTAARLGSAMALAALALAALGIHAVLRRSVVARRGEIAVRMSIGATPGRVLGSVLREALALAGAGVLLGTPLALAVARLFGDLLYGVSPTSPLTHTAAVVTLLGVAVAAAWLPARNAAATDPMVSLRS